MTAKTKATELRQTRAATLETAHLSSWIEVSVAALKNNLEAIRARIGPDVIVCPVIKSDAYGHGAIPCALALRDAGVKWLAVSTVEEGAALRHVGVEERILVLSGFWRGEEEEIVEHKLTPTVWNRSHLQLLESAATKQKLVAPLGVHLKINTGMNRLGTDPGELPGIYETLRASPRVFLEGMFSHFAASELTEHAHGDEQLRQFGEAVARAKSAGFTPPLCHMANSAAIASRPAARFNLVRPGLAVYGYSLTITSHRTGRSDPTLALPLQPALAWKARVVQIRDVGAGQPVGYSSGHVTQSATRVATLAVGYGDGLSRRLSCRGRVILRDHYAAILGNVSMNLTAVDITGVPGVEAGDEAILIGTTASCNISAWEHANLASTVPYEILCNLSGRLPRKYVE